jgi:hypothetical protein
MDPFKKRDSGIVPMYEMLYVHAMLFNTRSAITSIEQIRVSFDVPPNGIPADLDRLDTDALLNNLQNIVVQGAALSRYFWPTRTGHESRAARLRDALGVKTDNPLQNRDLRNEIEHFDEKLDAYLVQGIFGVIVPQYVGPLAGRGDISTHMFRAYYIDMGLFEMLGRRYEIGPIADEIVRLHRCLVYSDENGGRLQLFAE